MDIKAISIAISISIFHRQPTCIQDTTFFFQITRLPWLGSWEPSHTPVTIKISRFFFFSSFHFNVLPSSQRHNHHRQLPFHSRFHHLEKMAEIGYSIVGKVLEQLESCALQEISSAWGVRSDLKKLKLTLSAIKAVIKDAQQKQASDERLKIWLGELKDVMPRMC